MALPKSARLPILMDTCSEFPEMTTEEFDSQLNQLCRTERLGLVTDIDGVISPIAPTPKEAVVTECCRELLAALTERLPLVAILTGRAVDDARRMIDIPGLVYIGNHGLEE